jgi:FlaA1/EpsC-like NDP-sugar epimerase
VAREIQGRPDLGLDAVAFVDDDPVKQGTYIAGVPVLGRSDEIEGVAAKIGARQVLISMASAPGKAIRRVLRLCEQARLPVKIVPGLFELIGGAKALAIRDVSLEDLLRREPVDLDTDSIAGVIRDRVVLITGAGGSIGSELCRQVARFGPKRLVLLEQAENNLFFIERELRQLFPQLDVVPCVADVCDAKRVEVVFAANHPQTVFHAAAHKHVPMMEANAGEAVKNNVFGTMTVAEAADRFAASEFVLVSTDKAVNPASVMGATKRAAEIYVQALSSRSNTRFVAVRFGNVLGSAGSVVPIFREQIAKGGPITVTHPGMKRYFMTIPEATQLVLQAAALGKGGEILILDMGDPVRLVDLAQDLIVLSGLRPGVDIEITYTGIRPGEKLFEELSTAEEAAERTVHPRIYIGRISAHALSEVAARLARLRALVERGAEGDEVRLALREVVPEYAITVEDQKRKAAARLPAVPLAESSTGT